MSAFIVKSVTEIHNFIILLEKPEAQMLQHSVQKRSG